MFEIIGIVSTVIVVLFFLLHVGIKVYNWCKDDAKIAFELRKQSLVEKADWIYLIPTIGFHYNTAFFEISTTWLGWQYYICYSIKNFDEDYD